MSKHDAHDADEGVREYDIPDMDAEPTVDADEVDDGAHAERLAEIEHLAREGRLEAPAGAEEIVEALKNALGERDAILSRFQRALADHQNFQRRAANNEREAGTQARTGVVQSIIPILDHFELALAQDPAKSTAEQIVGGVRVIRDELMRVLSGYGVSLINPTPGDEFDPNQHEAMLRQPAEGVAPGCVSLNLGVGYKLGDRVVRPAKVAVAPTEDA